MLLAVFLYKGICPGKNTIINRVSADILKLDGERY